jgi:hypothetical protein
MLKKAPIIQSTTGKRARIGIIGGGPAGLSIARLLKEKGHVDTVVFEAQPQVGGKSFSVHQGGTVVEMGTCYATFSHKVTNKWMKEYRMPMSGLGDQRFDGADFMDYINAGYGSALPLQVLKYRNAKAKLEKALKLPSPPQWALEEAAMPIRDWLKERNLGKIEHFFHRSTTNIAYGFVDEVPTIQALVWNDMQLIWSGLLKQLHMPVEGWGEFWNKVASDLDVRLNAKVKTVERMGELSRITTSSGEVQEFDQIICAIPVDDFAALTTPTENEKFVIDSIIWNGYTTTLFAAENWFKDVHVEAYKQAVIPGAKLGQLLSARHDGHEADFGGDLYLSGQLSGDYTADELKELLIQDVSSKGGTVKNIILQKMWKYHAMYKQDAVRDGLMKRLEDMQGELGTWYTGATFSYEAVSHITRFNVDLAQKMHREVLA